MAGSGEGDRSERGVEENPASPDIALIDMRSEEDNVSETSEAHSQASSKHSDVPPTVKDAFDANTYAGKKTITQALFDLALISANASHLKLILQHHWMGLTPDFFVLVVTLLILSITLQLTTAVILFVKIRLDINKVEDQRIADRFNDCATLMIIFVTIINIFISAFSSVPATADETNGSVEATYVTPT
ncbi:ninjurin-2-like [Glandiceps talaboti]